MSEPRARKPAPRDKARPPDKVTRARQLRVDATPPERRVWARLRAGRVQGLKFRRQHPIGPYYADFYCDQARLVVELDSSWHDARKEHDEARDTYMNSHGFRVLRISVSLLAQNQDGVRRRIEHAARQAIEENRVARADAGGRAEAQKNR